MSTKVRVAIVAPATINVPIWAAEELGRFTKDDIEIATQATGSTEATTDLLLDGGADLAIGSADAALAAPDRVRILAGLADRPPLSLIAQPDITSFEDLRGKSIGTTSLREGTAQLVMAIMAAHGMSYPDDFTFTRAGAHPQRWQALQQGTIDAALQMMPFDFMAEEAGFSVLAHAEDYIPFFAFGSVLARSEWVDDNLALVAAFQEALRHGEQFVRNERTRAAALVADRAHLGLEHAARCVDRLVDQGVMPPDLVHSEPALDRLRQAMDDIAAIAKEPF